MSSWVRKGNLCGIRGHVTAIKLNREAFIVIAAWGIHASLQSLATQNKPLGRAVPQPSIWMSNLSVCMIRQWWIANKEWLTINAPISAAHDQVSYCPPFSVRSNHMGVNRLRKTPFYGNKIGIQYSYHQTVITRKVNLSTRLSDEQWQWHPSLTSLSNEQAWDRNQRYNEKHSAISQNISME